MSLTVRPSAAAFPVVLVAALAAGWALVPAPARAQARPATAAPASGMPTAAQLIDPPVAYTAQRVVEVGGKTYRGRVAHVPGRSREEMEIDRRLQVVILDRAAGKAWILLDRSPMMVEVASQKAEEFLLAGQGDLRGIARVGAETVAGRPATKYKVDHKEGQGHVWIDQTGILLRADGTAKDGTPFSMRLEGLSLAAPPAGEFQPPGDRQRLILDVGKMSGAEIRQILTMFGGAKR